MGGGTYLQTRWPFSIVSLSNLQADERFFWNR